MPALQSAQLNEDTAHELLRAVPHSRWRPLQCTLVKMAKNACSCMPVFGSPLDSEVKAMQGLLLLLSTVCH